MLGAQPCRSHGAAFAVVQAAPSPPNPCFRPLLQMTFFFSDTVVLLFDFWSVHSPTGRLPAPSVPLSVCLLLAVLASWGKGRRAQKPPGIFLHFWHLILNNASSDTCWWAGSWRRARPPHTQHLTVGFCCTLWGFGVAPAPQVRSCKATDEQTLLLRAASKCFFYLFPH